MPFPLEPARTKAISTARDRLQSRTLVWTAIPTLCYLIFSQLHVMAMFATEQGHLSITGVVRGHFMATQGRYDNSLAQIIAVSLFFAIAAWRLRAATPMAALCGGMICLILSNNFYFPAGSSVLYSALTPLLFLFILTFEATRLGRDRKISSGLGENRKGRNAAQVIANLGIAAFFSSYQVWSFLLSQFTWIEIGQRDPASVRSLFAILYVPTLAALAEATADTVSSEIGQAFGGTPRMILTLRPVPPGTDGAVTLLGTLAGIAAAALIALTGIPALSMSFAECLIAFAAGVAGLFFDSLLGATLERRGWLGNDLVNFSSTAFSAALALVAIRFHLAPSP